MHVNYQHQSAVPVRRLRSSMCFLVYLACSILCAGTVLGQGLDTNASPETATPPSTVPFFGNSQYQPASPSGGYGMQPAAPLAGTSQLAAAPPPAQGPSLHSMGLFHRGLLHIYPHIAYQVSYGNSLQSAPGQQGSTVINEVSPGITLALGSHWSLDYTPTLRFYSSHQFRDGVDHVVGLSGTTTYEGWSFGFSQAYASTSQPLIETASQLDQEVFTTGLSARHALGSKISLDMGINQNFRYVDQAQQLTFRPVSDTREWGTMEWLNYEFAPRLSAGLGAGFTYDNLSFGPDMTSEQLQARVQWTVVDKLTLQAGGGVDYRQFLQSQSPDLLSPIFSLSAGYHLFENTSLSLSGGSSVSPSYYENSLSQVTTISASLRQRLLQRLWLDVSGGYTTTTYQNTAGVAVRQNNSDYTMTSLNVRLSTVLLKSVSASVFFQENFVTSGSGNANAALFDYTSTQIGLGLGYHW